MNQEAAEVQNAGLYNALGLVRSLVAGLEQADSDHATADMADLGRMASDLLHHASSIAPELVLLGLEKLDVSHFREATRPYRLQEQTPLPGPAVAVQQGLLAQYMRGFDDNDGDKSSSLVFHDLWSRDPERLVSYLVDFYGDDETRLGRVVDIAKDLGVRTIV